LNGESKKVRKKKNSREAIQKKEKEAMNRNTKSKIK
jgi:hypothetical protein